MGRVWRAADEILDRQVAVKEMRIDGRDAEDSGTRRERTLREARATARIDHPNVVRVYDVVDEGERIWIVMELVTGRSLERILAQEGPLSAHETARIGLGLVAALRQVHAGGVLHRDIKPGNVLVENAGGADRSGCGGGLVPGQGPHRTERRVVLTDFGIAAIQDAKALTMVGMLVGSPDYMAPERISGHPQGPPSDVWSLGATLCAALGGRSPFARATTLATLHAVLYEEPELPAASGPLRGILTSLLAKDPAARPGLEHLEAALGPVAFPTPTATVPVGWGEAARPEAESRPVRGGEREPDGERAAGPGAEPAPEPVGERAAGPGAEPAPEPVGEGEPGSGPPSEPVVVPRAPRPPLPRDPRRPVTGRETAPHRNPGRPPAAAPPEAAARTQPGAPPSTGPAGPAAKAGHHPGPVALARAQAATEHRPRPASAPTAMPPGELPGPAAPATAGPGAGRRRTVLAAVAATVATAGAVVGVLLATQPGSPGDTRPRAGSSASPPPATGPTPTPTVHGTSRPRTLPPGAHREAGGFAWATPSGWRRDVKTGAEVHYTSPDGTQELVGKSSLARGNLLRTWQTSERDAGQGQDYRKLRLEETTFRGHPAVVWEYTFTLKGVHWHARLLGFDVGGTSYQVSTWYEAGTETAALRVYEEVKDSFTVL
ncbi:serine/threonine-protein kinase [Streptomyces djakartensis]|nr:serine/threonine-protein kinase [Streptomyces djakartensis]